MGQDHVQAMLAAYDSDDDFKAAVDAATSVAEVLGVAQARGFEVVETDLTVAQGERDLSDDELEATSGGTIAMTKFTCVMSIACPFPTWSLC